jgi:hypothetical protein
MLLVWLELRCDGVDILVGINILVHPPGFYDLGYSVKVLSGPFRQIKLWSIQSDPVVVRWKLGVWESMC